MHDHHHEHFEPPEYDIAGQDDEEDEHRGIPMVEDDVPEWVKLTFADKFIALGETEFLAMSVDVEDAVDKPENVELHDQDDFSPMPDDDDNDDGDDVEGNGDDGEYEYFYSDDEDFEFDPMRDQLINEERVPMGHGKRGRDRLTHHASVPRKPHNDMDIEDLGDPEELDGDDDEDVALSRAVHEHRDALEAAAHRPAAAIPINDKRPTWKDQVNQGVDNAKVSLLETDSFINGGIPSHAPGSRRANRRWRQNSHSPAMATSDNTKNVVSHPQLHFSSRYTQEGAVRLNSRDPRLVDRLVLSDTNVAMLQEEQYTGPGKAGSELPLDAAAKTRARNHREWLQANERPGEQPREGVSLPRLEKHMYSNGLPVADWEVGYVDNVLKQFGY